MSDEKAMERFFKDFEMAGGEATRGGVQKRERKFKKRDRVWGF